MRVCFLLRRLSVNFFAGPKAGIFHAEIKRLSYIYATKLQHVRQFFLILIFTPAFLAAQPEFDQRLSFDQIQALLTEGIDQRDPRKQALAWYYWAFYDKEQTGRTDSAFQYLSRSADRFAKAGDSLAYQRARADLADHLADRKLWDDALEILQNALDFARRYNNLSLETHLLARMSKLYSSKGDTQKALVLKRAFSAKNQLLKDTMLDIAVGMYEVQHNGEIGKYAIARYEASNALRLAEQIGRTDLINWGQYSVGRYSLLDGDHRMALFFLKKAEASTPRSNLPLRREIFRQLANAYAALDSLPVAFEYAGLANEIGDAMLSQEREAALHRLAIQFQTREKLRDIEALKEVNSAVIAESEQRKIGNAALAVALAAVLLALFFIVRDYRHRLQAGRVIAAQTEEINQQKIRDLEKTLKIETMQSMLAGQESERQRVAQDLHDSVGGLLAAVKIQLESMTAKKVQLATDEDWAKIRTLLDETVAETRHISRNMQPSALLEFGLVTALRDLTNRFHGKGTPHITFQDIGKFDDLDRDTALNCYRIIQELVQNSIKHAKAGEILVQITRTDNQIALLVEDDGKGFDTQSARKGMGTDNLARRTQFLKGELSVQSAPGQGTSTLVTVPMA